MGAQKYMLMHINEYRNKKLYALTYNQYKRDVD